MTYLLAKSAHVIAMITWIGGTVALLAVLTSLRGASSPLPDRTLAMLGALRSWDRGITLPAMLLTWALGLGLAYAGGWLSAGWLHAKLALVVGLSGLHGVAAGRLRRAAGGDPGRWSPVPAILLLLGVAGAVTLVITKVV